MISQQKDIEEVLNESDNDNDNEYEMIESNTMNHQLQQQQTIINDNKEQQPTYNYQFNNNMQIQQNTNNEIPYYNANTPMNNDVGGSHSNSYSNQFINPQQVYSSASPILHSNNNYSLSCFGPKKNVRQKTKFSTTSYNPIQNEQFHLQQQFYQNSQMNVNVNVNVHSQNNHPQQTMLSPSPVYHQHNDNNNTNNNNTPINNYINIETLALTPNPHVLQHHKPKPTNLNYALSPYIQHFPNQTQNKNYITINNKIHFSPLLTPSHKHFKQFEQLQSSQYNTHNTYSIFQGNNPPQSTSNIDEELLTNLLNKKNKKYKKSQSNIIINNNNSTNNNIPSLHHQQQSSDEQNKIKIEQIIYQNDKRTTLMIKNIPNKYTISTFLDEINVEFKNKYDVFYLPIDYGNKCNLGFAFINFVEPLHLVLFYEMYRGKKWKRFNSEKICELVYAKIQGKKELISHFEKGKVLTFESEEKRPLILPTPNPLPSIKLPMKVFDLFVKSFPNVNYIADSTNAFFIVNSISKES